MKAYALKAHIRGTGSELQRIGRSRNWQLKATRHQLLEIIDIIEQADEQSWLWLASLLKSHREHITHDELLAIARRKPGITVNELLTRADCTLAQARIVIDELEGLD
ncbi:hypothetical protein SG34_010700 [Thalassomonas viridans]|uniref:Ribosome recycling factor n=2 Tax=Thalassomonas viridans TaxID=137584 RepID=A0AAE9Z8M4_9GAMM|nr:hypothetical protein SG34_010700 [Thalassomonas viridans]